MSFLRVGCVAALGSILSACVIVTETGTGTGSDGGVSGDAAVVDSTEACGVNGVDDTRATSRAFLLGGGVNACVGTAEDVDYYEFTAPSDNSGGYVSIEVDNVSDNGAISFTVESGENDVVIFDNSALDAASITGFIGVVPGEKYRVAVRNYVGFATAFKYRLKLDYTRINDSYEPNDKRDDAKAITIGTAVNAYMWKGFGESTKWDDWYKVTLAAGNASINVTNVPTDVAIITDLVTADGTLVVSRTSTNEGAAVTLTPTLVTAGTYYVRVGTSSYPIIESRGLTYPDSFTRAYALTISQ